jgi:hypothetical protein
MPFYRAYIVGLHDRPIGVVQLDCTDDESAIKSAARLVGSHDVELWQMDRPVARLDARSKQVRKKQVWATNHKHGDATLVVRDVRLGQTRRFDDAPITSGLHQKQTFIGGSKRSALCRYCCKSRKLHHSEFLVKL